MLDGRVAMVTGGGRGVGAEVAKMFAANGAKVLVNDPGVGGGGEGGDEGPAVAIANEIKAAGGEASANFGSVTSYEDCLGMVQQARDELGGLHIIFNPAGILRDRMFHKMSPDDWQDVLDVHLTGHYNVVRTAINLFREQEYGRIIMCSSTSGLLQYRSGELRAAKMGIAAMGRIIAMENGNKGITCNTICPSADTRMTRSVPTPKDAEQARVREERLTRSRADAIAPLITFLASEGADYVNGQIFHQRAGELSLYSQPRPIRMVHHNGGWTPELIAENGMPALKSGFLDIASSRNVHPGLPMD